MISATDRTCARITLCLIYNTRAVRTFAIMASTPQPTGHPTTRRDPVHLETSPSISSIKKNPGLDQIKSCLRTAYWSSKIGELAPKP